MTRRHWHSPAVDVDNKAVDNRECKAVADPKGADNVRVVDNHRACSRAAVNGKAVDHRAVGLRGRRGRINKADRGNPVQDRECNKSDQDSPVPDQVCNLPDQDSPAG